MNELIDNSIESCVRKAKPGSPPVVNVDVWVVGEERNSAVIVRDWGEGMTNEQLEEMMTYHVSNPRCECRPCRRQ